MSGTATALSSYSYPTALSWGYPHLEVFALSSNNVYWKYRGLASQDTIWNPTDGSLALVGGADASFDTTVAAIARGGQNVNIFIAGSMGDLIDKYHQNSSSWSPVGSTSFSSVSRFKVTPALRKALAANPRISSPSISRGRTHHDMVLPSTTLPITIFRGQLVVRHHSPRRTSPLTDEITFPVTQFSE
jgi:hypothetical protein